MQGRNKYHVPQSMVFENDTGGGMQPTTHTGVYDIMPRHSDNQMPQGSYNIGVANMRGSYVIPSPHMIGGGSFALQNTFYDAENPQGYDERGALYEQRHGAELDRAWRSFLQDGAPSGIVLSNKRLNNQEYAHDADILVFWTPLDEFMHPTGRVARGKLFLGTIADYNIPSQREKLSKSMTLNHEQLCEAATVIGKKCLQAATQIGAVNYATIVTTGLHQPAEYKPRRVVPLVPEAAAYH